MKTKKGENEMRKILNVGCGNDTYGSHFVDFYPSRDEVIKVNLDSESLPFPDNYFEEVYSYDVIEHLRNIGFFLNECKRVLKSRGKLIIHTDNASYYGFHLRKTGIGKTHYGGYEKEGRVGGGSGKEDKHYALFTTWHLLNHFQSIGMKRIKVNRYYKHDKNWKKQVDIMLSGFFNEKICTTKIKIEGRK